MEFWGSGDECEGTRLYIEVVKGLELPFKSI
jgi:hypothetical protein